MMSHGGFKGSLQAAIGASRGQPTVAGHPGGLLQ